MHQRTIVHVADLVLEIGSDLRLRGKELERAASTIFKVLLNDYLLIPVRDYACDQYALREVSRLQTTSPTFWLDLEMAVYQILHDVAVKSWHADEVSVTLTNNVLLVDLYFDESPRNHWNPHDPNEDNAHLHRPIGR